MTKNAKQTIPNWQKRDIGLYWTDIEKEGFNPRSQELVIVKRRQLKIDYAYQ